ncbi:MAG: penicillin-binding protein 2 [Bifidobacteriaceae bacterium]|jgi:cell division protein FtsI (penicillin-binding protein 3)|nr:penicillin-binding protein 2 [Bifidobacteriaceae bacterium]MCI1979068.1 penicillin-binding protein 2 [Bifidobacteriaceae bacterium]
MKNQRKQGSGKNQGRKNQQQTTGLWHRFKAWLSPKDDTAVFSRRTQFLGALLAVAVVLCVGQLARIQLLNGASTAQAATNQRTVTETLSASRGTITDSDGNVLAQSVERYTVYADQNAVALFVPVACTGENSSTCNQINGKSLDTKGAAAVAQLLAPVLGMDSMELGAKLNGDSSYVVLKKNVVPSVKRNIDKLNLSGVIGTELTTERSYPSGTLAGSIVGATNSEGTGVAGVEKMEDSLLKGTDGKVTYQQGSGGQEIPGTRTTSTAAKNGGTVKLTLNSDVQWYVEKALKDGKKKYHANWGIAIVQEVSTGKLLAVADTDGYEAGSEEAAMNGSKAMTTAFEPGSTGKLITAAALMQEKIHKATDKFKVPYSYDLNGQNYHDSHAHGVEKLTLAGIIKESSNVGMVMSAKNLSYQLRYNYLTRFGIGKSTGIGFPGESTGILSKAKTWDERTANTVLFGQGYAATALQMTNVVATIANGGVKVQQSLVDSTTDSDGATTENDASSKSTRILDKSVASDLMDTMESVTETYAKSGVKVNGYRIAGKSGTAQVADSNGNLTNNIGDWIGAIPADNPKYVVMVAYMNPQPIYGGMSAGPVMASIGGFLMQKYAVQTSAARKNAIDTEW